MTEKSRAIPAQGAVQSYAAVLALAGIATIQNNHGQDYNSNQAIQKHFGRLALN